MATFNSRLVRCPLCTNVYQDPRILPCSDAFCKTYLQDYINKTSDSSDSFPCPECRKQTDVSKLKQIRAQWAETFPINNLIVSVLQRFSFRRFSEEIQQTVKCIPCSLDGKQSDAFSFCVTCAEYLCQQCCDIHGKFKETRGHFVLKNNQLPKDRSVYERIEEMCHCKAHPDRQFDYRCNEQACNTFLCSICATVDHRQHNIIRIDKMDNTCRRRYLQIENQDTLALKSKVQNTMDKIVADGEALQNDATKIKYSTCLLIEKLVSSITRVKNDVTLELCRQIEKKFSMRSASIPDYVDLINKLSMLKETTETVVKHGTEQQVLICIDEVKNEKALLCKRMPRQNETLDDIVLNRQNLRSKIEHLNTIFDILLDISCKLFETLEINEEAEIPFDYERVLTVYKNGENSHGDNSFCKVIFHGTPSLDGSILVMPVLKKEYKHTIIGTDTVSKKDVCVGTETLRKKDVSLETSSAIQRDKSTATDRQWWKNDKSVQAGKSCIRTEHIERSYDSNILLKPVKTTSISANLANGRL